MLLVMPLAGRLTDRFGGGRVAVAGVSVLCLGTLPLAFVGTNTSILAISLVLLAARHGHRLLVHAGHDRRVRLAAPRSALRRHAAAERRCSASAARSARRCSRSCCSARPGTRPRWSTWRARSTSAYWWSLGIAVLSLIPCVVLLRAENPQARLSAAARQRRGGRRAARRVASRWPRPATDGAAAAPDDPALRERRSSSSWDRPSATSSAALSRLRGRDTHLGGARAQPRPVRAADRAAGARRALRGRARRSAARLSPATVTPDARPPGRLRPRRARPLRAPTGAWSSRA